VPGSRLLRIYHARPHSRAFGPFVLRACHGSCRSQASPGLRGSSVHGSASLRSGPTMSRAAPPLLRPAASARLGPRLGLPPSSVIPGLGPRVLPAPLRPLRVLRIGAAVRCMVAHGWRSVRARVRFRFTSADANPHLHPPPPRLPAHPGADERPVPPSPAHYNVY